MNKTLNIYEKNFNEFLLNYNNANTEELNKIFLNYLHQNSTVLDLGFGSGRDLRFLFENGFDVYGLDSCENFIKNFQHNFIKVSKTTLPDINVNSFSISRFDSIISIATLMHLTKNEITKTFENIKNILNKKGILVISYSTHKRIDDKRFFEDLDETFMFNELSKLNFKRELFTKVYDGMNRDFEWIIEVYKND